MNTNKMDNERGYENKTVKISELKKLSLESEEFERNINELLKYLPALTRNLLKTLLEINKLGFDVLKNILETNAKESMETLPQMIKDMNELQRQSMRILQNLNKL